MNPSRELKSDRLDSVSFNNEPDECERGGQLAGGDYAFAPTGYPTEFIDGDETPKLNEPNNDS